MLIIRNVNTDKNLTVQTDIPLVPLFEDNLGNPAPERLNQSGF